MLVVSFTHPHDPYVTRGDTGTATTASTSRCRRSTADDVPDRPALGAAARRRRASMDARRITDEHVRGARRAYLGNVSYVDDWTARLIAHPRRARSSPTTRWWCCWPTTATCSASAGLWYKMNFFEGSAARAADRARAAAVRRTAVSARRVARRRAAHHRRAGRRRVASTSRSPGARSCRAVRRRSVEERDRGRASTWPRARSHRS